MKNKNTYYLINSTWDSYDMTAVFLKKSYWELDPEISNQANMKLLTIIKKGCNVLLVKIKKSSLTAIGKHIGVIKKIDLKKNRIYITWSDILNESIMLPVKCASPVIGPLELPLAKNPTYH